MNSSIEEYIKNPIKRHIILNVMKQKKLKYSQLLPEGVDNVLFNYHLQHLVKNGILIKEENYYTFSPEGWVATSHITYDGIYFPKFVCRYRLYVINNNKVLLHKRKIGPFENDTTAIWGKLVYGEALEEVATFQLKDQTGLEAKMKTIGTIRTIIHNKQQDILDDSIYFICVATEFTGEANPKDLDGNPLDWYDFDQAIKLETQNKSSGNKTVEVLKQFKNKDFTSFVFEETLILESL